MTPNEHEAIELARERTADEFDSAARLLRAVDGGDLPFSVHYSALAAFQIAAAVMRQGVIERACAQLAGLPPEDIDEEQWRSEASIIRRALTAPTDTKSPESPAER